MRIMGADLSMTATGVAFPDSTTALIKPRGKGYARLLSIEDRMSAALRIGRPDLVVIEDIRAGLKGDAAKVIPMVHCAALLPVLRYGVPYVLVNSSTLKLYATGYGASDKASMAVAALTYAGREFPGDKGGDQCDAWWLRAAGHAAYGEPVVRVPKANTDALREVDWPTIPGAPAPVLAPPFPKQPRRRRKVAA
jgi:Holliday junction resolvasome RuvABC endonuclease subunit